jgi:hypothetical protein
MRWIPSVLTGTVVLLVASHPTGTVQTLLWLAGIGVAALPISWPIIVASV